MMKNGIATAVLTGLLAVMTGSAARAADIVTAVGSANKVSVRNNRDLIVAPGLGEGELQLHFAGADRIDFGVAGELSIVRIGGGLAHYRPEAYQMIDGKVQAVVMSYKVEGKDRVTVKFGNHDNSAPVIVKRGAATL